jgi:hypothetical protein
MIETGDLLSATSRATAFLERARRVDDCYDLLVMLTLLERIGVSSSDPNEVAELTLNLGIVTLPMLEDRPRSVVDSR